MLAFILANAVIFALGFHVHVGALFVAGRAIFSPPGAIRTSACPLPPSAIWPTGLVLAFACVNALIFANCLGVDVWTLPVARLTAHAELAIFSDARAPVDAAVGVDCLVLALLLSKVAVVNALRFGLDVGTFLEARSASVGYPEAMCTDAFSNVYFP